MSGLLRGQTLGVSRVRRRQTQTLWSTAARWIWEAANKAPQAPAWLTHTCGLLCATRFVVVTIRGLLSKLPENEWSHAMDLLIAWGCWEKLSFLRRGSKVDWRLTVPWVVQRCKKINARMKTNLRVFNKKYLTVLTLKLNNTWNTLDCRGIPGDPVPGRGMSNNPWILIVLTFH